MVSILTVATSKRILKIVPFPKYACFFHPALWNQAKCLKCRQWGCLIMFLHNWVVFTHLNWLWCLWESGKIQIRQFYIFKNRMVFFWIRIGLNWIVTCLKSIIHRVRKSFLVDIWANYSLFSKKYVFVGTPKRGVLRIHTRRSLLLWHIISKAF